jgi:lysophospholipase L1-like esterase
MDLKEKVKSVIENNEELLVIFAGDSHTWGQGANGAEEALEPPPVLGGEIRRLPQNIPCFAALFADYIKAFRKGKKTYALNFGFGCSSTRKYLAQYWQQAVERFKPDILVITFAINDWLVDPVSPDDVSLEEFKKNINEMIDRAKALGTIPVLLTVSPIRGTQYSNGHYYQDYIEGIRSISALRGDVLLADANKDMTEYIRENGRESNNDIFFDDWHVNQKGHQIYFEALKKTLSI